MSKKTRLLILLACVACFFVIAPILVLYSMGYRFDFERIKITATGGIYVRTFPAAEKIVIDSKISKKLGVFSNSIFIQSLLPSDHTVLIEKIGYYDYFKTIPVQEKEVTKLENIILFKKNIKFELLTSESQSPFNQLEKFIIKKNNLYHSDSPENVAITPAQKLIPVIKNLLAFALSNNNIIWLSTDGFLYQSDSTDKNPVKLILNPIKINKTGYYKVLINNQNIFVVGNGNLLLLNTEASNLDIFSNLAKNAKISPDEKNIIYFDDKNIYSSLTSKTSGENNILYKSSETINDCIWLNNDYIIFVSGNKIIISEIDYRGNINFVTLPQTITLSPDKKIEIVNPKVLFNQQTEKLYILTGTTLLVSEKLIP